MAVSRDEHGRFVKGNAGGGRTKQPDAFKDTVKENALPALMVVIAIMNSESAKPKERLMAASIILERAYGKAPQAVDLTQVTVSVDTQAVIDRLLREGREAIP